MTLYCLGCGRFRSAFWGPCQCGNLGCYIEFLDDVEGDMSKTRKKLPPNKPIESPAKMPHKKKC